MKLNQKGLKKLNEYINVEYGESFALLNDDKHGAILFGEKSNEVSEDLKRNGIILEEVEPKKYVVMVEAALSAEPTTSTPSAVDTGGQDYEQEKDVKRTVSELIPHLSKHFATKDEINKALNDLRAQLVDPEELTTLFKDIALRVKKTQGKLAK